MTQQQQRGASRQARSVARGLGWFGIGIGLIELLLPRTLAAAAGVRTSRQSVQMCGAREVATGLAILCLSDPAPGVWARVAGDAIDLSMLGAQANRANPARDRTALALAAVAGAAAVDLLCARSLSRDAQKRSARVYDYSSRSGLPRSPDEMRGAARADFEAPRDLRTPPALRPLTAG